MRVAVVQLKSGDDKKKNIAAAMCLVKEAARKGAKFVSLPEVFNYRGPGKISAIAESIPGESSRPFFDMACRYGIFILLGSLYERIQGSPKAYNTSILINSRGKMTARYRKVHLFLANIDGKNIRETQFFKAGKKTVVAQVGDFKVGLSVCYDLRFGRMYNEYARKQVNVMCVPSAFTRTTGKDHWEVLLRARAIENISYVLAPNQAGPDGRGVMAYGHSLIIDPWGKILARGSGNKEEILFATLSRKFLESARAKLPGFKN